MRAVVLLEARKLAVRTVADAEMRESTDVLLRLTSTAICGTDLHFYEGRMSGLEGHVIGHEPLGVVEEVGAAVKSVKKGDRVVVPMHICCGFCAMCVAGYSSACFTAHPGHAGAAYGYNFTPHKLKARQQQLELDRADRDPSLVPEERVEHLKEKIATVRKQMRKLKRVGGELARAPDQQVSLTDPDARSMATSGRGTGIVGYNVQTAVDSENHLIVAQDVVNQGHDREQLAPMAELAKKATGRKELEALADRGYFDGEQILKCEQADITPLVPKPLTSNAVAEGRFDKRDFVYNRKRDEYRCPAGQRATWRFTAVEGGLTIHRYWSSACPRCPMKSACTLSDYRRISRWEHEDVLERMQARLDRMPQAGSLRRQTVEHTFGTLKAWMGATHFLTKHCQRSELR